MGNLFPQTVDVEGKVKWCFMRKSFPMQHPLKPSIDIKKLDLLLKLVFSPFKVGYRLCVFAVKEDMFCFLISFLIFYSMH